jgi:hypothetical protein
MKRLSDCVRRLLTLACATAAIGVSMPLQASAQTFIGFPDADPRSGRFRGVRIWDISDINNPAQSTRATVLLLSAQRPAGSDDRPCSFDVKIESKGVAGGGTETVIGERRIRLSENESPRTRVLLPGSQMAPSETIVITHGVVVERASGTCLLLVGAMSFDTLTGHTERVLDQFTIGPPFVGSRGVPTERPLSFVGGSAGQRVRVLLSRHPSSAEPPCSLAGEVVVHHIPPEAPDGSGPSWFPPLEQRHPISWSGDIAVVDVPLDVFAAESGGRAELLVTLQLHPQVPLRCIDTLGGVVGIFDDTGRVKVQFMWDRRGKLDRSFFNYHYFSAGLP